jgi:hypothetical protein
MRAFYRRYGSDICPAVARLEVPARCGPAPVDRSHSSTVVSPTVVPMDPARRSLKPPGPPERPGTTTRPAARHGAGARGPDHRTGRRLQEGCASHLPTPSLLPRSVDNRLGVARCRQATAPDVEAAPHQGHRAAAFHVVREGCPEVVSATRRLIYCADANESADTPKEVVDGELVGRPPGPMTWEESDVPHRTPAAPPPQRT